MQFFEELKRRNVIRVAAEHGGIYDTHMRDESTYNIGLLAAIEETLPIGREAQIPVHIAHIKALGVDVWGQSAADIEAFMRRDWVMTSSDGTDGHPRKYASFPKKYRDSVADRGRIEKGYAADIIAFDPDEFAPVAKFAAWNELSVGVIYSMINGQLFISGGQYTGILPGLVLLRGK